MISTTSPATTRTKTTPPTVMASLPRYLSIRGSPDRESRRDSRHGRTRRRRRRAPSALARTEHDADGAARGHEGQRPEPPGRHGHHGRKGQKTGDEVRHRLGQHLEQGDPDHPDHRGADPLERSVHPRDPPDALEHWHDGEHQHERGQEDRGTTHDRPPETADSITNECREHHDWPRRELTECQAVQEFPRRQPLQLVDHLVLDEGQNRQAASEGEGADLEEDMARQVPGYGAPFAFCRADKAPQTGDWRGDGRGHGWKPVT